MVSQQKLIEATSESALHHGQELQARVEDVWKVFFRFDEPVETGKAIANVAFWALGPANPDIIL